MIVDLQIEFTPRAKETLKSVFIFILEHFGEKAATKFKSQANKVIILAAKTPYMYKAANLNQNVRVGLITKHCSLLYEIADTKIILHAFWDNRQEPFLH